LTAAGFTAAHAFAEVEPDVARCLAQPERLLAAPVAGPMWGGAPAR
jgi:glycerate kinase